MTACNIYYGTIGKTLGVKYRFSRFVRGEADALKIADKAVHSFFFKNEGKFGLPSFDQISEESSITGIDIEKLYDEHIKDMCRFYAIPTELDTVPERKLKW